MKKRFLATAVATIAFVLGMTSPALATGDAQLEGVPQAARSQPAATVDAASIDEACLAEAAAMIPDYVASRNLPADAGVYASCSQGIPSVWSADDTGVPIEPMVAEDDDSSSRRVADDGGTSAIGCDIYDVWAFDCDWGIDYRKYNSSGAVVWTRHIDGYADVSLQEVSQKVKLRFTNTSGYSMDTRGDVIIQRQNGIFPPIFDNSEDFNIYGGTQTAGTYYVSRLTASEAKFSIIFNLEYVHDDAEGVDIPIFGDPTGPRFQCFDVASTNKNCEFPNGQEAGIF